MTQRITTWGIQLAAATALLCSGSAWAQIKVGVVVSATGPAASLGIPEKNTIALMPKEIGGKKVEYIVLDDASDTTSAVKNTHKLISEDKVDVIIGSTVTPNSLAMISVAAESETPMISMSAAAAIVEPMDAKRYWIFKTPQSDSLMASAIVDHMVAGNIKTVAFIGLTDSYGQNWWAQASKLLEQKGIKILANESYAPTDSSVTGQILRVIAGKPGAVLIASRGTPAVLPQKALKERGYAGRIYQTHGVANSDFLRLGSKDVEGTLLPAGPLLVAAQLPDSNPVKKTAMHFKTVYEKEYGAGSVSTFGGHAWDAGLMLEAAVPEALKKAQPGTKEFRQALRDSIENMHNLVISQGIMSMSKTDHSGLDQRARLIVKIENGKWVMPK
ncbi:MAG TPA: ABC transporter substrate-binding protein [Burkholderiaceae bacterium]|nr:ABC transporter substrate-binding protein [Burkholderiaceae bacterium]